VQLHGGGRAWMAGSHCGGHDDDGAKGGSGLGCALGVWFVRARFVDGEELALRWPSRAGECED
jgi:hypothetical protein